MSTVDPASSVPAPTSVPLRNPGAVDTVDLWLWDSATTPSAPVVLLAHGAGSRGDHPVHTGICSALAATGHTVAAFNFPYAQAGRKAPDRPQRLLDCFRDVAAAVTAATPGRALVAGGRSMGGRIASLLAAEGHTLAGLALLNYPLVSARGGAESAPRVDHWPDLDVPVLFVHGTRDRLLPQAVFEQHRHLLAVPVTVHVVDGADHVFALPRAVGRTAGDVHAEVAGAIADWTATLPVRA